MSCIYIPGIGLIDFALSAGLIVLFLVLAARKKKKKEQFQPEYRYYFRGLLYKLFACLGFVGIYVYYYKGGDTLAYHQGAVAMRNLFYAKPDLYFDLVFGPISWEKYINYFTNETCRPPSWMVRTEANFSVIRIASFFQLFLPNAFLATSLLFSRIMYSAIFRLYSLFCYYFPGREGLLSIPFLFFPSLAFWTSGIMKDTIAMTGICWFVVLFHELFILRKRVSLYALLGIAGSIFAVYMVKPYLVLALIPGMVVWYNFQRILSIKSAFVKVILFPLLLSSMGGGLVYFYVSNSDLFGDYGANSILEEAAVVQQDLIREESYGSNSFNIGTFEPTIAGVLSKTPEAIVAGLFRPFLWEAGGSPTMLLSGLENLLVLILFFFALFKTRIIGLFKNTLSNPLLILGLIFTLLLAFSTGLTAANFGALVRYKMPLIPFFISILVLAVYKPKTDS